MIYLTPIVGPLMAFVFMFFLAIPFYYLWNALAPTYFYWLPKVYLELPFWDCVWLLMLIGMLKLILLPKFSAEVKK